MGDLDPTLDSGEEGGDDELIAAMASGGGGGIRAAGRSKGEQDSAGTLQVMAVVVGKGCRVVMCRCERLML